MVTSAQLRAARSILNWTVRDLAEKSGVHRNTITRAETEATTHGHAVAQLVRTLETAGIEFDDDNQQHGVRMRALRVGDKVHYHPKQDPGHPELASGAVGEVIEIEQPPLRMAPPPTIRVRFGDFETPWEPQAFFQRAT